MCPVRFGRPGHGGMCPVRFGRPGQLGWGYADLALLLLRLPPVVLLLFTFSNLAPFFMMVSDRGEHSINIPHWMLSEIVALKGNHAALFTFSNLAPFFCGFG